MPASALPRATALVVRSVACAALLLLACSSEKRSLRNDTLVEDAGITDAGTLPDASVAPPIADVPCNDDGPCDDGFACTDDRCDRFAGRCVHVAHDEQCDDGVYCNGFEVCNLRRGCIAGGDVCGLGNGCNIARCDEQARTCSTVPRDADADGDPDDHCGGGDCDDTDARRSSRMSEICGNGLDDNCNGQVDEAACLVPQGADCSAPFALPDAGERTVSTAGSTAPVPSGCPFPLSASSKTIFVTVPRAVDRDTVLEVSDAAIPVTLVRLAACGTQAVQCEQSAMVPFPRVRVEAGASGTETFAVVTAYETTLRLRTYAIAANPTPLTGECTNPPALTSGVPVRIDFTSLRASLPSDCTNSGLRSFVLDVPVASSLTLAATSLTGSGSAVIGLRQSACVDLSSEIACRSTDTGPLVHPSLAAGRYVVTAATTGATAIALTATLGPPSSFTTGSLCLLATPIAPGQKLPVSFDDRPDLVRSGCSSGGSAGAFRLDLPSASDVLYVGRLPPVAIGSMALLDAQCTPGAPLSCTMGSTPFHVARQAVSPGPVFVALATNGGGSGTLAVYTRPPTPETPVAGGGGDCATAVPIGANGGRFSGDSTGLPSTIGSTCDTALANPRAPTQLFMLNLPTRQRVLLDTHGSAFTTVASIRSGATCPGLEIPSACHVGFTTDRSFLDRVLDAGTYWIVLTGFDGAHGQWVLDAFLAAP